MRVHSIWNVFTKNVLFVYSLVGSYYRFINQLSALSQKMMVLVFTNINVINKFKKKMH